MEVERALRAMPTPDAGTGWLLPRINKMLWESLEITLDHPDPLGCAQFCEWLLGRSMCLVQLDDDSLQAHLGMLRERNHETLDLGSIFNNQDSLLEAVKEMPHPALVMHCILEVTKRQSDNQFSNYLIASPAAMALFCSEPVAPELNSLFTDEGKLRLENRQNLERLSRQLGDQLTVVKDFCMRVWPTAFWAPWPYRIPSGNPPEGLPSGAIFRLLYGPLYGESVQIKHAETYVHCGWEHWVNESESLFVRGCVMNTFQLKRLKASVDEALSMDEFATVCLLSRQLPVDLAIQIVGLTTPFSERKADPVSPRNTSLAQAKEYPLPDGLFFLRGDRDEFHSVRDQVHTVLRGKAFLKPHLIWHKLRDFVLMLLVVTAPVSLSCLLYSGIYPDADLTFTPLTATLFWVKPALIVAVIYVGYLYGIQSVFQIARLTMYQNTRSHHAPAVDVLSSSGCDQSIPAIVLQPGSELAVPMPPPGTVSEPVALGTNANVPASP